MATVFDVAAYILNKRGPMSTWKLQKLVYYSQAWSLAWDEKPLFKEEIQAWANGPVCPDLYYAHQGKFEIERVDISGNTNKLSSEHKKNIDIVLKGYGKKTGSYLSELTHREGPWMESRKGLAPNERGNKVIHHDLMAEFYRGLLSEEK
jgi:uncharacterized phage-associated protein